MEKLDYKKVYEALKEDGILEPIMPNYTGKWEKDKEEFIKIQEDLDNSLSPSSIDTEDL